MVSPGAVEPAAPHAAFPETCVPNRRDTDRCGPASHRAPYRRVQRGNPRFTFVSEGKPLRRLLLISNSNSSFMTVLLPDGLPVTSQKVRSKTFYNCVPALSALVGTEFPPVEGSATPVACRQLIGSFERARLKPCQKKVAPKAHPRSIPRDARAPRGTLVGSNRGPPFAPRWGTFDRFAAYLPP